MIEQHAYIPGHLAVTDERLANWGRWARERRRAGRALSAEGRYVRERLADLEADAPRRRPAMFVDVFDASRVDVALAPANGFDRRASALLKAHYVFRAGSYVVARRAGVQVSRLAAEFERALVAAHHALGGGGVPD